MAGPRSSTFSGIWFDKENARVDLYNGVGGASDPVRGLSFDGTTVTTPGAITVTAGGLTVTSGDVTVTADDVHVPLGFVNLGTAGTFATTQGVGIVKFGGTSLTGVAPAGAITTACAIFASDTVMRKIIAASTVSNIET